MKSIDTKQATAALSALSQETRLAIYRLLVEKGPAGLSAGAIAEELGVLPSSLSFHLAQLHRAGLVTQRRVSRSLIYAAEFGTMNGLIAFLTANCCGRAAPRRRSATRAGRRRLRTRTSPLRDVDAPRAALEDDPDDG